MADLPIDEPKADPKEAAPSEAVLVEEPVLQAQPSDLPRERPRVDVGAIRRTFDLDTVTIGRSPPRISLRVDGTEAILKTQLAELIAAEAFRQQQDASAARIEALRQAIRDLGAEPKV